MWGQIFDKSGRLLRSRSLSFAAITALSVLKVRQILLTPLDVCLIFEIDNNKINLIYIFVYKDKFDFFSLK